ncbi:MAG: VWA domain-containing protein [Candidatus Riflebacteria bacterium]|nr:VWA domain-containing protein [Candidatus Riflebacteria bacterium]
MMLLAPAWLLLLIPLVILLLLRPPPSRGTWWLRSLVFLLVALALAEPIIPIPGREGVVVVVADRSRSMPAEADSQHQETIKRVRAAMPEHGRMAVVSFGETSAVELAPGNAPFQGFFQEIGRDGSVLGEALDKGLSLIPQDAPGRILILSDGNWTGIDPARAVHRAGHRQVPVDYRLYGRSGLLDLAFDRIDVPPLVQPGESFLVTCWIRSPVAQEVRFTAWRGAERLANGLRQVPAGLSRVFLKDQAGEDGGVLRYSFQVVASAPDPLPENNAAQALVGVAGARPLLLVTNHPGSAFPRLIESAGLRVRVAGPGELAWSLDELAKFCGIVLDNVPAGQLGLHGMQTLGAWLTETGGGLLMAGGKNSFGPGGYFRSSLDPLLPVSMELRSEHRKMAMAIAIVMDRSGSMAMAAGGGKTKMDLANLAAVEVLNLMSTNDELGVIAVDSSPHVVVPIGPITAPATLRSKILSVESEGGGIFIYEGLAAGAQMLNSAQAQTKHMILFADACDSEQPGQYWELVEKCRRAGMTVSVVGLGEPTDPDAPLLVDIAKRGGGRSFFTPNPQELPRIFAQDTFVVSRSTFVDEPTPFAIAQGMQTLTPTMFGPPPSLGGYNLCYLRPGAFLGAVTTDEYKAPVVAAWQTGAGRVLTYAGELDGPFTGPLATWNQAGDLFSSLARWVAGGAENLAWNTAVTRELVNGLCRIRLHLDPGRDTLPFSVTPEVVALRSRAGEKPASFSVTMDWAAPDLLTCDIPLLGGEVLLAGIRLTARKVLPVPPVCLPYSAEFAPDDGLKGAVTLEALAAATGGKDRLDLPAIWKDMPRSWRQVEIASWLLLLAAFLFLLEVLERRTGVLGQLWGGFRWRWPGVAWDRRSPSGPAVRAPSPPPGLAPEGGGNGGPDGGSPALEPESAPPPPAGTDLATALKRAKGRARQRSETDQGS